MSKRTFSRILNRVANIQPIERKPFPIRVPDILPGVIPKGRAAAVAMDSRSYDVARVIDENNGFPGYAYLSQLATRTEYRSFANALSIEITREWIEFMSSSREKSSVDKIDLIEAEFNRLGVREAFRRGIEQDALFGRAQFFIDIRDADRNVPLILDPRIIRRGSLIGVRPVEAIWTTPSAYNAQDPTAPDFYAPSRWFMLGQEVHATRLITVVTREMPDILKPAFNFGGISLSQLAEPYVDNWLRTQRNVSNLIDKFSITALKTNMGQMLMDNEAGDDVVSRAQLFTAFRNNFGLFLMDNELEDLLQLNTPLGGLHELQAQAQEAQCSAVHIPAVVLLGVAPSGFGNVAEGEVKTFKDRILAEANAFWLYPLQVILKVAQLSLFGEIDPAITVRFKPIYQMTELERASIRLQDAQAASAYVAAGVIDPSEERERLAGDPESGYQGLDTEMEIIPPNEPPEGDDDPAMDANLIDVDPMDSLTDLLKKGMQSELDAEVFYGKILRLTDNEEVRAMVRDIMAEEEKHFGQLEAVLAKLDPKQVEEMVKGLREATGSDLEESC